MVQSVFICSPSIVLKMYDLSKYQNALATTLREIADLDRDGQLVCLNLESENLKGLYHSYFYIVHMGILRIIGSTCV